jgi:hypothetical protein
MRVSHGWRFGDLSDESTGNRLSVFIFSDRSISVIFLKAATFGLSRSSWQVFLSRVFCGNLEINSQINAPAQLRRFVPPFGTGC